MTDQYDRASELEQLAREDALRTRRDEWATRVEIKKRQGQ